MYVKVWHVVDPQQVGLGVCVLRRQMASPGGVPLPAVEREA